MAKKIPYAVTVYHFTDGTSWLCFSGRTYPYVGEPEGGWQALAERVVKSPDRLLQLEMPNEVFEMDYEVEDYTVEVFI